MVTYVLHYSFNLTFSYGSLIITIFDGISNNKMLFKVVLINPSVIIKNLIIIILLFNLEIIVCAVVIKNFLFSNGQLSGICLCQFNGILLCASCPNFFDTSKSLYSLSSSFVSYMHRFLNIITR